MFLAIFFLFLNTGPSNTALANVSLPAVRATAFAANIFVIHAFGDVKAFWLLGYIGGHTNMRVAFLFVSGIILLSGVAWLIGVKYLPADTAAVETAESTRMAVQSFQVLMSILRCLPILLLIWLTSDARGEGV